MTLTEHLQAIQDHRKAVFDYFGLDRDLGCHIEDMTDVWWCLNGTSDLGWWDERPGKDAEPEYDVEVAYDNVWEGTGFTMTQVRSDTGHDGEYVVVLDNSKRVEMG